LIKVILCCHDIHIEFEVGDIWNWLPWKRGEGVTRGKYQLHRQVTFDFENITHKDEGASDWETAHHTYRTDNGTCMANRQSGQEN
jgi:hypothetical protein